MTYHERAHRHLKKSDPVMACLIKKYNLPPSNPNRNRFKSLVETIINQQLSVKAAETILKRFLGLFPGRRFPLPKKVLAMPARKMRTCGISYQKISYLKNLAADVAKGNIDFGKIRRFSDEEAARLLTQVNHPRAKARGLGLSPVSIAAGYIFSSWLHSLVRQIR